MNGSIAAAAELIPDTVEEALDLIDRGYRPVAGGTDLMVRNHAMKNLGHDIKPVFYTARIEKSGKIAAADGIMSIGASVTLAEIISCPDTPQVLRESLLSIASPGIRNTATLAGNICNSSPAADSLPALYILNAIIQTASKKKEEGGYVLRNIPVSEFITGPGKNLAGETGFVVSVSFNLPETDGYVFRKIGTRAANALSKLSVAAIWNDTEDFFRLAVGACAPTVIRSVEAEKLITGSDHYRDRIKEILGIYEPLLKPIDDQRSSARYRKNTALRLIESIILNRGG